MSLHAAGLLGMVVWGVMGFVIGWLVRGLRS